MTDQEIIQKFADLENRIRYLEMTNGPAPFPTDATAWSTPPTQGCSQEEQLKYMQPKANWTAEPEWDEVTKSWKVKDDRIIPSYHCTHEHP